MNNIKDKIKSFIETSLSPARTESPQQGLVVPASRKDVLSVAADFNKTSEENEFIDDLNYVKLCYEMLKQFGLIDTQYQFSEQLLNKSKFYYSMLISEGRKPSIHSMQRLVSNMKELLPLYKKENKKDFIKLNSLINEGVDVITKRVLKLI